MPSWGLYGYDELQRLTSADYGDGEVQGYTFDAMGNRLTKTVNGTPESYGYNNANMLLTRGAQAYVNDNNGNTLTGGGRINTWDGQNRLTQCVYNGNTSSFVYGSDGLRRRATVQGVITDHTLDGQSVVREAVQGGATKTYLHGARGPEYERTGSASPLWNLFDGMGSVLGTVDANGNLVSTRKYDVYGAVRATTGPSGSKHKYVGSLGHPSEDETGLVYMRARYMDPVTGRFASEDPAKNEANWFSYGSANSTNRVDIDGRISQWWVNWIEAAMGVWLFALSNSNTFRRLSEGIAMGFEAFALRSGDVNSMETATIALATSRYALSRPPVAGSLGHEILGLGAGYSATLSIWFFLLFHDL